MSEVASRPARLTLRRALPIVALSLLGFALTLRIFYPGIMTYDAWYVHADAAKGEFGDWQSPLQTALWVLIERIVPGAAGMFLFIATLYWLAFAVLGLALARRSAWLGRRSGSSHGLARRSHNSACGRFQAHSSISVNIHMFKCSTAPLDQ